MAVAITIAICLLIIIVTIATCCCILYHSMLEEGILFRSQRREIRNLKQQIVELKEGKDPETEMLKKVMRIKKEIDNEYQCVCNSKRK